MTVSTSATVGVMVRLRASMKARAAVIATMSVWDVMRIQCVKGGGDEDLSDEDLSTPQ